MLRENLRSNILPVILVIALVFAVSYILFDFGGDVVQMAFQQGLQIGYEQTIIQLMQQVSTCQSVPLISGNQTISVVAVNCLQ